MAAGTNFLVKVSLRSHTMMGKFLRSLYVGRRTLYLGILAMRAWKDDKVN
jgi:hypothetical protein